MNSVFYYSLLQYRYAQSLGEVLNIGVLLLFPEQRQLTFLHPDRLGRIRHLYPTFAEKVVRSYLKGISARVQRLNRQPEIFANYEGNLIDLLDQELLVRDSTALEFGELTPAVLYTDDLTRVGEQFYQSYLAFYDDEAASRGRHDEAYLLKAFQQRLRRRLEGRLPHAAFNQPVSIQPEGTDLAYQFAFAWQNGSYNLVKPVSFDLKLEHSINEKATLNVGQFTLLQPYAERQNARFDVLVGRPASKALYKPYEQAVRLLRAQPRVQVVEEESLDSYSDKAVEALISKEAS